MAEAAPKDDFDSWLSTKLKELNTDESVFGSYIKGILEGEETEEEKTEALEEIISQIIEPRRERPEARQRGVLPTVLMATLLKEILDHWKACQINLDTSEAAQPAHLENVGDKLAKLLESNVRPSTVQRQYTEEERKIREAILAQYSQTSDLDSGDEDDGGGHEGKENGLVKNTNASSVHQAEREKREKAKIDSQKKKEKDKEDREKQKQQQQDKKEKRKTQKGERRR